MQRIAMRDRSYERNMQRDYIDQLNQAYERHFGNQREPTVLAIDCNTLDYVRRADDLRLVADRIRQRLQIPPFQQKLPMEER
jgi:deoxyguanosine kinase